MLRKLTTSFSIPILVLVMALGTAQPAFGQPPSLPHQFYGTVTIGGNPASSGVGITIEVNGTQVASITTDSSGKYGYNPSVTISGTNGATVDFYVNGVQAQQSYTLSSGAVTKLDLTAGTGSTPPPPAPPAPPPPPPPAPSPTDEPQPPSTPTPTSTVTISTSILGQAGSISVSESGAVLQNAKTVSSADNSLMLSFQANTVIDLEGGSLTASAAQSPPAAPSKTKIIAAYEMGPSNSSFSPALTLTVKYDEASLPKGILESNLYIAYWTGTIWSALTSTVDTQANTVAAPIAHFSTFAILGKEGKTTVSTAPANFSVSDLKITPATVTPGEKVTITAMVTNSGGNKGTFTAMLIINEAQEDSKDVTVEPNKSQKVTFTTTKTSAGSHSVAIADQTGAFTIAGEAKAGFSMDNLPLPVIAAGALVIILLIIIIALATRRRSAY